MSGATVARQGALRVLREIERGGAYTQMALEREWRRGGLSGADARLVSELVRGVLVWRRLLDEWIARLSTVAVERLELPVRIILRMGLYQLRFFDRVPPYAIVSDAVELARVHAPRAAGFVNGVLRGALREADWVTPLTDCEVSRAELSGVRLSYPDWLVRHMEQTLGDREAACGALLAMNRRPERTVRANLLRCTREELIARLADEGVPAHPAAFSPVGVVLPAGVHAVDLAAYAEGWCTLQGQSSMLIAPLLDAREGMDILDACAAPGGKATHLAELTGDRATVTAVDIHAHRTAMIESQARRMGHRSIRALTGDSALIEGEFDRVLLDVPCSGLGTIGRKPDLRWRASPGGIRELAAIQRRLLLAVAARVRPGGILVYAACTLSAAENERQIAALLAKREDFVLLPWRGAPISGGAAQARILPQQFGGDGFFVARLQRLP